jgi:O-antigen/teichoic acid export membrane protein
MQILCGAAILRSIGHPIGKILQASGRPELEVRVQFGFLVTLIILVALFSLWLGLVGVSIAVLISAFGWYVVFRMIQLRRVANIGFAIVWRALLPSVVASAFMAAGILIAKAVHFTNTPGLGFLVLLIAVGGVLYTTTICALLGRDLRVYLGLNPGRAIP